MEPVVPPLPAVAPLRKVLRGTFGSSEREDAVLEAEPTCLWRCSASVHRRSSYRRSKFEDKFVYSG